MTGNRKIEGETTLTIPLTHEERLSLDLWIQDLQIEISIAEKHFRQPLPEDNEVKLQLANLLDFRKKDDSYFELRQSNIECV